MDTAPDLISQVYPVKLVPENSPWPRMLVWPLGLLAALAGVAAALRPHWLYRWAHCPLHDNTGIPCFTCGGTHCLVSLVQGRWSAAWQANPLLLVLAVAFAAWALVALAATIRRDWRRSLVLTRGEKKAARWLAALVILLNWFYLLMRS